MLEGELSSVYTGLDLIISDYDETITIQVEEDVAEQRTSSNCLAKICEE